MYGEKIAYIQILYIQITYIRNPAYVQILLKSVYTKNVYTANLYTKFRNIHSIRRNYIYETSVYTPGLLQKAYIQNSVYIPKTIKNRIYVFQVYTIFCFISYIPASRVCRHAHGILFYFSPYILHSRAVILSPYF